MEYKLSFIDKDRFFFTQLCENISSMGVSLAEYHDNQYSFILIYDNLIFETKL